MHHTVSAWARGLFLCRRVCLVLPVLGPSRKVHSRAKSELIAKWSCRTCRSQQATVAALPRATGHGGHTTTVHVANPTGDLRLGTCENSCIVVHAELPPVVEAQWHLVMLWGMFGDVSLLIRLASLYETFTRRTETADGRDID